MNTIRTNLTRFSKYESILFKQKKIDNGFQVSKVFNSNISYMDKFLYLSSYPLMASIMLFYKSKSKLQGKKPKPKKVYPKDTVVLYQFPRAFNTPSLSPFALKLETWCRAAEVDYQNFFSMKLSSKGVMPFIKLNKTIVEDSAVCIEYLTDIFGKDLDSHLTIEQKVQSRLIIKMIEESLKWCMGMFRFIHNKNSVKDAQFPLLMFWNYGYRVKTAGYMVGWSKLTKKEIFEIVKKDFNSLEFLIGQKYFLFSNDKPSEADFALFGLIAQFRYNDKEVIHQYLETQCPNIIRSFDHIKSTYWKDWDANCLKTKNFNN